MNGWINVDDKLSEMYVDVLVYTEYKEMFIANRIEAEVWEDRYGFYLTEYVTHWRPLPEPPESEE